MKDDEGGGHAEDGGQAALRAPELVRRRQRVAARERLSWGTMGGEEEKVERLGREARASAASGGLGRTVGGVGGLGGREVCDVQAQAREERIRRSRIHALVVVAAVEVAAVPAARQGAKERGGAGVMILPWEAPSLLFSPPLLRPSLGPVRLEDVLDRDEGRARGSGRVRSHDDLRGERGWRSRILPLPPPPPPIACSPGATRGRPTCRPSRARGWRPCRRTPRRT